MGSNVGNSVLLLEGVFRNFHSRFPATLRRPELGTAATGVFAGTTVSQPFISKWLPGHRVSFFHSGLHSNCLPRVPGLVERGRTSCFPPNADFVLFRSALS